MKLTSLSCGTQNVWAVDSKGNVHLRIGLKPPSKNYLSPAWVPVDGSTHTAGSKFTEVVTGPNDWMVRSIRYMFIHLLQGYICTVIDIHNNSAVMCIDVIMYGVIVVAVLYIISIRDIQYC